MYRYRDNSGATERSLERSRKHTHKVGEITEIRGVRYHGRYNANHEGIRVRGNKGTARFSGFLWGYHGQGPRGLETFLHQTVGVPAWLARKVAFDTERRNENGVDWILRYSENHDWQLTVPEEN